jgi:hypothetical protein
MKYYCIVENLKFCGRLVAKGAEFSFLPLLIILWTSSVNAQYFNLRIDFMGYGHPEVGFAIEQMDNGNYIVFHSARPEAADDLGLGRTIISTEGEVLQEMAYFDPITTLFTGHSNTSFKLADGGFVSSGSRTWFSGIESLASLCRYDENGELDWIKFYGDSVNQTIGRAAAQQLNNMNLAAVGGKSTGIPGDTQGFLVITDSLGNELAFKEFGGSTFEHLFSLFPTFDGGYILGGYTKSYGTVGKWDHYLIKTDSLGNQEWMRVIGSDLDDCPANVIQTADGNYVFCGCWTHFTQGTGVNFSKLYMAKLDQAGELIWEKEYLDEPYHIANLRKVVELPNGDLLAAGLREGPVFGDFDGLLLRTDAEGNEKWLRSLKHPSITGTGFQFAYDIIVDTEGWFVGTGWMFNPPNDTPPGQDLWVFRTDSMGCLVPGCHIVDNVEVHEEEVLVSMYPNPVHDLLSVHLKSGPMPRSAQLELYDMHGRRHSTTTINPGATTYILPMGHLPAGMYVIRCVTEGKVVWSGKVVKE